MIEQHVPIDRIQQWLKDAADHPQIDEPTAITVATASKDGMPSVRTVLLKGFDKTGIVFYTNAQSQKGQELSINPQASILFYWMPLKRQIRISGNVTPVIGEEADAYFASRRRGSQIGAHASDQSAPLESFETLMTRTKALETEFNGAEVPRPEHWHGWRVALSQIEFWQEGDFRLHERELYTNKGSGWEHTLLNP
ncbi:MAG: pyridoxamine 5'-phosphate oxidase [Rickettsiales bacterium]|nr:pyridoxamine 5'-phosphate oxidase [Rickettsiales bacterium]